jgi:hypothetical protein
MPKLRYSRRKPRAQIVVHIHHEPDVRTLLAQAIQRELIRDRRRGSLV